MNTREKLKKDKLVWNQSNDMDITAFGNMLWQDELEELTDVNPKHKIVFLVQGLSSTLLDTLDENHPLNIHKKKDIYSVIPTTEINTMISFYKGISPSEHGILGEFQHNKELNVSYCYTSFLDRIDKRHLSIYQMSPSKLYQFSKVSRMKKRKYYTLFPSSILMNDSYQGILEGLHVITYHGINDMVKKARRPMRSNLLGTTTVVYITELETMMKSGSKKEDVSAWLNQFTDSVTALKHKNNMILISSLHGHTSIDASIVLNYVKYNKYFYALPSIETRMTSFYIKEDFEKEFVREFKKDYGHLLGLYKTESLSKLGIFGPNKEMDQYGEYIAINLDHNYLEIPINENLYMEQLNNPEYVHACTGGMSKEEVIVPLILL